MVAKTTHGMTNSPTFVSWTAMKSRCLNPNSTSWKSYGGRGIKVCDRWINSFENFLEDMGERPGLNYSIEREDNDGDYEPGNCHWATDLEQSQNRRTTAKVKDPETNELITYRALYEKYLKNRKSDTPLPEVPISVVAQRLGYGWDIAKAVETPMLVPPTYYFQGSNKTLVEIGKIMDVSEKSLGYHINKGMTVDQALDYLINGIIHRRDLLHSNFNTYEYEGKHYTVKGLAALANIPARVIADRLHSGFSIERALTEPIKEVAIYNYQGRDMSLFELTKLTGIPRNTLRRYLDKGMNTDEAVAYFKKRSNP